MDQHSHTGIRNTVESLIARHGNTREQSIASDTLIWERFPSSSSAEHASVTAFVDAVHSTFNVYLTEEEWDNPTVNELAGYIGAKFADPPKSAADWQCEHGSLVKGLKLTFTLINVVFVPIALFAAVGSWSRKVSVTIVVVGLLNALLAVGYWQAFRRHEKGKPRAAG
jgi:hypothetical protein